MPGSIAGLVGIQGVLNEVVAPETETCEGGDVDWRFDVTLVFLQFSVQVAEVLEHCFFAEGMQVDHVLLVFLLLLILLLQLGTEFATCQLQKSSEVIPTDTQALSIEVAWSK
jgi:hypothetical protein